MGMSRHVSQWDAWTPRGHVALRDTIAQWEDTMSDHDIDLLAEFLAEHDEILTALYMAEICERLSILKRAMSRADGMVNDHQEYMDDMSVNETESKVVA